MYISNQEIAQGLMATLLGCQQVVQALATGQIPAPTIASNAKKLSELRFAPHYAPSLGATESRAVAYTAVDVSKLLNRGLVLRNGRVQASRWVRCALDILACWELQLIDQAFLNNIAIGVQGYNIKQISKELRTRLQAHKKPTAQAEYARLRRLTQKVLNGEVREPSVVFTPVPESALQ